MIYPCQTILRLSSSMLCFWDVGSTGSCLGDGSRVLVNILGLSCEGAFPSYSQGRSRLLLSIWPTLPPPLFHICFLDLFHGTTCDLYQNSRICWHHDLGFPEQWAQTALSSLQIIQPWIFCYSNKKKKNPTKTLTLFHKTVQRDLGLPDPWNITLVHDTNNINHLSMIERWLATCMSW